MAGHLVGLGWRVGVKPLRTKPGGYTAPFNDALLAYEVQPDYPRIHLGAGGLDSAPDGLDSQN